MKTRRSLISLANEAPRETSSLIGLANEYTVTDDGWALIPYGIHGNERGRQRFQREDAEKMLAYFKNGWATIKRAFVGMPVFRGHPDMADMVAKERDREKDPAKKAKLASYVNEVSRRWPDKKVYGTVGDMQVRDAGLALKVVLTEEGATLVNEKGLRCFSPHWLGTPLPPTEGGPDHACIYLVSIGLTDRPNIAGTSLVNSQPTTQMNPLIIALLAAMGRTLANELTEEQISAALRDAVPHAKALAARPEATALANEQTSRTKAENDLAATKAKLTETETALANERTALANERKAHATALIATAIAEGRITEASKPVWQSRLERDFVTEATALANERGAVKTNAKTAGMGGRKESSDAATQFTALVNEALPACGNDRDKAWAKVKATAAGKALLEQMAKATAANG